MELHRCLVGMRASQQRGRGDTQVVTVSGHGAGAEVALLERMVGFPKAQDLSGWPYSSLSPFFPSLSCHRNPFIRMFVFLSVSLQMLSNSLNISDGFVYPCVRVALWILPRRKQAPLEHVARWPEVMSKGSLADARWNAASEQRAGGELEGRAMLHLGALFEVWRDGEHWWE